MKIQENEALRAAMYLAYEAGFKTNLNSYQGRLRELGLKGAPPLPRLGSEQWVDARNVQIAKLMKGSKEVTCECGINEDGVWDEDLFAEYGCTCEGGEA